MKTKIIFWIGVILFGVALLALSPLALMAADPAPVQLRVTGDALHNLVPPATGLPTGFGIPSAGVVSVRTGGKIEILSGGTLDIQSGAIVNFPTGFIPWVAVSKTGSSLADLVTRSAADLSSGTLLALRMPAMTGDATSTVGTVALTLATVNSNIGTFAAVTVNGKGLVTAAVPLNGDLTTSGSLATLATVATGATTGGSTAIPVITFNNKGLVTAVTTAAVIAPAGTLTGTTLASNVVTSSLTTVGTIGTGVWQGTVVAGLYGGTGVANSGKTITLGGNLTTSGAFATTLTSTALTSVTLPTSGTLATLAGSEALTNKTYNGNTWTAGTGTLAIAAGKTVTQSNTLTYTGTDGSTVNFGAGGTVLYSGGAYVSSIAGTANRITASAATGAVTLDIAATYVGQTSITTLGTIGTGTWQGSIISATYGGTGNGFTAFTGPTTSTKTFTLPDASATILTTNAAVTVAQGGTGRATSTTAYGLLAAGTTATGAQQTLAAGLTTEILVGGGASALPAWTTATGSGAPARATSPTFVTPVLGAATATSINGLAISLTTGTLTINSAKTFTASNTLTLAGTDGTTMTFPATSATIARTDAANTFTGTQTLSGALNYGGVLLTAAVTGTGSMVLSSSPTLVTPVLGVATATSINGNTFTTGTYTLTGTAGKTLNFSNTLTLAGTDSTTMTFPTTSATIARTDTGQTFTGSNTFSSALTVGSGTSLFGAAVANSEVKATRTGANAAGIAIQANTNQPYINYTYTSGGLTFNDETASNTVRMTIGPTGIVTIPGVLAVSNTTASTSTATGSATFGGGIGVAGAGWFGGNLVGPGSGTWTIGNATGSSVLSFVTGTTGNNGMTFTTAGSGQIIFTGGTGDMSFRQGTLDIRRADSSAWINFADATGVYRGNMSAQSSGTVLRLTAGTSMDLWLMAADGSTKGIKIGNVAGDATFTSTTASTSTVTGSGIFGGGIGVGGAIYGGGALSITSGGTQGTIAFNATSATPGAAFVSVLSSGLTGSIGINLGKAVTNNQCGQIYWDQTNTRLTLETFSSGDPLRINTSFVSVASTTEATTGGAGAVTNAGGSYTAKKIIGNSDLIIAGTVIHTLSATPASASATGTTGTISWDASFIYICTATNTWKRVAIATW